MTADATGLDALHDIVGAPPAPFWPPAPAVWMAGAALFVIAAFAFAKALRLYRADAYRRAALREFAALPPGDDVAPATLLRRTALAAFPREEVVPLSGTAWIDWLEKTGGVPASAPVRTALLSGIYGGPASSDGAALRFFVESWIRRHHAGRRTR